MVGYCQNCEELHKNKEYSVQWSLVIAEAHMSE
jgi:hypothetical protein